MPRVIVIKGADEGKQFELADDSVTVGRDAANRIRLHDTEVSRKHAEFFNSPEGYRLRDLKSANGTYVNSRSVRDVLLQVGDQVQVGQTVLLFTAAQPDAVEEPPVTDLASRINLIAKQDLELTSAIVGSVSETEGSRILARPDAVQGVWLKNALANLGVLYETTQAVSHILDVNQLLDRILELIFRSLEADRGCVLLRGDSDPTEPDQPLTADDFAPKAARWRDGVQRQEKIPVSRTILDYVLKEKKGILVSDAARDERFQSAQSIVRSGVREIICVPMKGRHETIGVLYLDTRSSVQDLVSAVQPGKFTMDHLHLAIAIAHQAALAVEETRYHHAMVQAERLAAMGQTIAALSHHIKNILQGLKSGGEILQMGLSSKDESLLQHGWKIVEKNQGKIYDLVMDMLSYSKEREPGIEQCDLNSIVNDVKELLAQRAADKRVTLTFQPTADLPRCPADPEGIHRAVLNIVGNALDAVEERPQPRVAIATGSDGEGWVHIVVTDNGPGVPPEKVREIFRPFVSTKGSRGTGLGLAVSRKILREHGGDIVVESQPGKGSRFTLRLPLKSPFGPEFSLTSTEIPVAPPPD